ncbi:unnamed protein product [Vicia faba]|uniref:Transmembrane protein n=1 Tax=Vicia faba TaxID=3906 RepID=A0AAV0YVB5_VICFA|nr:unnamed protein product [Vicia faba]
MNDTTQSSPYQYTTSRFRGTLSPFFPKAYKPLHQKVLRICCLFPAMAANRFSTIVAMLLVVSVALASLPPPPPGTFASAPYQDVFDETNNTNRNSPKSIPTWVIAVTGVGLGAVFMAVLSCAYLRPPLAAGSVLGEPVSLQLVRARAAPYKL